MKSSLQHQSPSGILRAAIEAWREDKRLSREAVAVLVMEARDAIGAAATTDFTFDGDTYDKAKKAAQKLYRWLDDGALPANMIPCVMAALPLDVRRHCADSILRPLGLTVSDIDLQCQIDLDASAHLSDLIKEGAEAQMALVAVRPGAPLHTLESARKEVGDLHERAGKTMRAVDAAIARAKVGISKICHIGDKAAPHE